MPLHSWFQSCLPNPNHSPPSQNINSTSIPAQQPSALLSTSEAPSPITLPSAPPPASQSSNHLLLSSNNSGHSRVENSLQPANTTKVPAPSPISLPNISPHTTPAQSLQIKSELLQENLLSSSSSLLGHLSINSKSNLQLSVDGLEIVDQNCAVQHSNSPSDITMSDTQGINFDLLDYDLLELLEKKLAEGAKVDHDIHDTLSGTAGIDPRLLSLNNPSSTSTFSLPVNTASVSSPSIPHLSNLETSAQSNQHQNNTAENPSTPTTWTSSHSSQHSQSPGKNNQISQHTNNKDKFGSHNPDDADLITTTNSPLSSPSSASSSSSFSDKDNDNNKMPQDPCNEDELGSNDPNAEGITDNEMGNSLQEKLDNKVFFQLANTCVNINHNKGNTTAVWVFSLIQSLFILFI